eukprot:711136-Pelagomonas_calceolata.AAC.2
MVSLAVLAVEVVGAAVVVVLLLLALRCMSGSVLCSSASSSCSLGLWAAGSGGQSKDFITLRVLFEDSDCLNHDRGLQ